jgi:hypothetical protein
MTHVINLLYGDDRRIPDAELNLNQLTAGEVRLSTGGIVPNAGELNAVYSGSSVRFDGEIPISESRGNMRLELKYVLKGGSLADVARIQRGVQRYSRWASLNADGQAEAVWLEYRWNTNAALDSLPRPTWGQLNYYARVLSIETRWPDELHSGGMLENSLIEGVLCTIIAEPYWYGLPQEALNTTGLMDVANIIGQIPTGLTLGATFTIMGWGINSSSSTGYFCEYYVDASNFLQIYRATSSTRLRTTIAGTGTNIGTTATSANTGYHMVATFSGTGCAFYLNGVSVGTGAANTWGAGVMKIGGTVTGANSIGLDGWRIFVGTALTAAQIAALYAEEQPVKTAGGFIGKPPYHKTTAGAGVYDNVDGTLSAAAKDNWGIIGNVQGDTAAKAIIRAVLPTSGTTQEYWLSRLATLSSSYTPNGNLWLDLSGTTDTGNSSGDAYEAKATTVGITSHDFDAILTSPAKGKYTVLTRGTFDADYADTAYIKPFYKIGSGLVNLFDGISTGPGVYSGAFMLKQMGSFYLDWPGTITPSVTVALRAGTSVLASPWSKLVSAWRLEESSGAREDCIGIYDLTAYNTPTTTTGAISTVAASFASASSEYMQASAGHTSADIDWDGNWAITCWVNLTSKGANLAIVSTWLTSDKKFLLYFDNAADRFKFSVTADGSTAVTATASTFGAPSTATWYFIHAYHNADSNVIGISVNNGTADTTAHTTGVYNDSIAIEIGSYLNGTAYFWNGAIDAVHLYGDSLTSADLTTLYGGGTAGLEAPANTAFGSVDFIALLPSPACHVTIDSTPTLASGDRLTIDGKTALVEDASDSYKQLYGATHEGEPITVEPGHYNVLTLMQGDEGATYPVSNTATVTIDVVPRFTMPGGLIA